MYARDHERQRHRWRDSVQRRDQTVVIEGNRITRVGPSRSTRVSCRRAVDGRGKFLIPGLGTCTSTPPPSAEDLLARTSRMA